MRTPIRQFAKQEHLGLSYIYSEARAGRLVLTKVGSRTFVEDTDADRWRALAPKIGEPGVAILEAARLKLETLGKAVKAGQVDRDRAAAKLAKVIRKFPTLFEEVT